MMTDSISLHLVDPLGGSRAERADAAENRRLVLQTAARLFAERGVADVTMADIAQAAEIGKGTLYRRYANKAELCLALLDDQFAEFQNGMLAEMRLMSANATPYLAQLDIYLSRLVAFSEQHSPLLCEVEHGGLLLENTHPELPHLWHAMTVASLLRMAQRQGEISADLDAELLAEVLLSAVSVDHLRYLQLVRHYSQERILAALRSIIYGLPAAR